MGIVRAIVGLALIEIRPGALDLPRAQLLAWIATGSSSTTMRPRAAIRRAITARPP